MVGNKIYTLKGVYCWFCFIKLLLFLTQTNVYEYDETIFYFNFSGFFVSAHAPAYSEDRK